MTPLSKGVHGRTLNLHGLLYPTQDISCRRHDIRKNSGVRKTGMSIEQVRHWLMVGRMREGREMEWKNILSLLLVVKGLIPKV